MKIESAEFDEHFIYVTREHSQVGGLVPHWGKTSNARLGELLVKDGGDIRVISERVIQQQWAHGSDTEEESWVRLYQDYPDLRCPVVLSLFKKIHVF